MPFKSPEARRAYQRARYQANPERQRETMRKWREANPEKVKAQAASDPKANAARQRAYRERQKAKREADPGWQEAQRQKEIQRKVNEALKRERNRVLAAEFRVKKPNYHRMYRKTFVVLRTAERARRRAAKLRAIPGWADLKAIRAIYEECRYITNLTGEEYHVDHIVPLQSKIVCGLHWERNLRIIPGPENCSKSNLHWPDMP